MVTEFKRTPIENEAAKVFIEATRTITDGPLLAERDYVVRALAFATTVDASALHSIEVELVSGVRIQEPVYLASLLEESTPALRRAQAQFLDRLEIIQNSKKAAHLALANEVWSAGEQTLIRPTYLASRDGIEVHYRYYPVDLGAALNFVLLLLLDTARPYGRDLCRCRLKKCQRFFLAIRRPMGRPRRDYCSPEHLEASRAVTGVQRVQAYRKRQREAQEKAARRRGK